MKKLSSYFANPFLAAHLVRSSRENKEEHTSKALAAFTQNPPAGAVFPPLIEAYRVVSTAFSQMKDQSQSGMPLASSQRLKSVRKQYVALARYLSSKVKSDFESDPAEYTSFFPQGMYKATLAKRGDVAGVIEMWRKLALARQTVMGAAVVSRIADLKLAWNTAQAEQSGHRGMAKMAAISVPAAWEAVAWASYDLARALADANPRNPRMLDVYFDFKMFTRSQSKDTDGKADLRGTVLSAAGLPIARALLTLTEPAGGKVYQLRSNTSGRFRKRGMLPALYHYTVKAKGFTTLEGKVHLLDSANPEMEFVMDN